MTEFWSSYIESLFNKLYSLANVASPDCSWSVALQALGFLNYCFSAKHKLLPEELPEPKAMWVLGAMSFF